MFFYFSKIFWFFIQPLNLALFLLLAGIVALFVGWRRVSLLASSGAFLILAFGIWSSLGALMLNPLEERFQRPALPERVDGVVMLGGGLEGAINLARGGYELNASGDRLVETAILARRFPQARIVISGGAGTLLLDGEGDADTAPRLLTALGIESGRLVLENKSRDTFENAQFTKALVSPKSGETWLLVTSAFHMPRSMALFRKADFAVLPWPVDYRTSGIERVGLAQDNSEDSLRNLTTAMREWIGLAAYWASGRIDTLFPGPV